MCSFEATSHQLWRTLSLMVDVWSERVRRTQRQLRGAAFDEPRTRIPLEGQRDRCRLRRRELPRKQQQLPYRTAFPHPGPDATEPLTVALLRGTVAVTSLRCRRPRRQVFARGAGSS